MSVVEEQGIANQLERFLRERFQIPQSDSEFNHQINLWDAGYVDSLGTVEVIAFLESTFGVKVPDNALFFEKNTSVAGLAELVTTLRQ
jgi:D-alanine--poly(phosphoribitol) ligase subunit 2